mmetsp:Transcript_21080/g.18588  ORF Transcript_21080/g.18588 Transcript_21080/m.18588 type:complete len:136 (+) Transcript_21080:3-410(+)
MKDKWYEYSCYVINFFANNSVNGDLLIFDIENDPIDKMINFFQRFNTSLNGTYWSHRGKTKSIKNEHHKQSNEHNRGNRRSLNHKNKTKDPGDEFIAAQTLKWHNLTQYYPDLLEEDFDLGNTEYQRIMDYCNKV